MKNTTADSKQGQWIEFGLEKNAKGVSFEMALILFCSVLDGSSKISCARCARLSYDSRFGAVNLKFGILNLSQQK